MENTKEWTVIERTPLPGYAAVQDMVGGGIQLILHFDTMVQSIRASPFTDDELNTKFATATGGQ